MPLCTVNAQGLKDNFVEVAKEVKYYKVTTYNNTRNIMSTNVLNSVTEEITKQEYESESEIAPLNIV